MRTNSLYRATLWATILSTSTVASENIPRGININNESNAKLEVFWINPGTGERVLQSTPYIYKGANMFLNSFLGHTFEAREMPGRNGTCLGEDQTCRVGYFTVNGNDEQAVFIDEELNVRHQDHKTIAKASANELMKDCVEGIKVTIEEKDLSATEAVKIMKECVESGVALEMEKAKEEISFQGKIRRTMGEHFENYTCADYDLETTEPLEETKWYNSKENIRRDVKIMLDRPASKVHLVKNFISDEECAAMEEEAAPLLHKATVADGKGGSELSPNRKAMQAGIKIPWHLEEEEDLLAILSRRVYDYTNHVLDMDIDEHGQEDLMSIQYEGRGEDDETPDRYTPHCDGDCTGLPHRTGGRMATVVVYCAVPEKGGATNFRNSAIHVVPERGSATFFSYIDPNTMIMDDGFTEHSGCPVIEGEKKIVTQWVRYGVDQENPWDSFNTLGIKMSELDD
mmetsp:Transcript_4425/g.6764  ORF Transcript_4425/g.6764 Transcript_4425/m.6764 type:complete len:456 (+) Transcript_4425:3-1370(+)